MSDRDDIRAHLAENPNRVFHRIDIITALAHISPASIDAGLSWLVRNKHIEKPKTAHYQHKPDAVLNKPGGQPGPVKEPTPRPPRHPWLGENLAPYQRVRLFIENNGPVKKQMLCVMLAPFVDGSVRSVNSMVAEGMMHVRDDDLVALGPSPKTPTARKHWDPRRERQLPPEKPTTPNNPSEEVKRESAASDTSIKPEAVATPTPEGDVHDEAHEETLPPGIGLAAAIEQTFPEESMPEPTNPDDDMLDKSPGTLPAPTATFHVELPGLHIAISGEAKAVMQAVAAIEKTIGAE